MRIARSTISDFKGRPVTLAIEDESPDGGLWIERLTEAEAVAMAERLLEVSGRPLAVSCAGCSSLCDHVDIEGVEPAPDSGKKR